MNWYEKYFVCTEACKNVIHDKYVMKIVIDSSMSTETMLSSLR